MFPQSPPDVRVGENKGTMPVLASELAQFFEQGRVRWNRQSSPIFCFLNATGDPLMPKIPRSDQKAIPSDSPGQTKKESSTNKRYTPPLNTNPPEARYSNPGEM